MKNLSTTNPRLFVHHSVSPAVAHSLMRESDACLVHLRPDPLFSITIPSKTQAYLYAGAAIIMCCDGEASELCQRYEFGVFVRPGSPKSLAKGLQSISNYPHDRLNQIRSNSLSLYASRMSFARGTGQIRSLIRALF